MKITMVLKSLLGLSVSLLFIACDQHNLNTPSTSSNSPEAPSELPSVPKVLPKDIPLTTADAVVNGKMYFKDAQTKFYRQTFGKVENGQITFIDSDIDFLELSQDISYNAIFPDKKGGFYIQTYLENNAHLLYMDKSGKLDTKVKISLSGLGGFHRALECFDCPENEIYLLNNYGKTLYLLNTNTHSLSLVDMVIKTCGINNSNPLSCFADSTWRQDGITNLGNYSRLANGRYLYYKTNMGEYIYVEGQFYTGFILIDLIKKQVVNLDFNFEYQVASVWTPINSTQYNAIKIYDEGNSNGFAAEYPILAMNVSTFSGLATKRIRITLPNGTTNSVNLSGSAFYNNKILFDFQQGFYIKPQYFAMNLCNENPNSDRVAVKAKNSSRRCYSQVNKKINLNSFGILGTGTLVNNTQTKIWETAFEISDLDYFKSGSYIEKPLLYFDHSLDIAYFMGRTNYSGFENKSALYKLNLTDGSLAEAPIVFDSKGKFSSATVIFSGNYFVATNLVQNATGLIEVDAKTGTINNYDITLKLNAVALTFEKSVKQMLPINDNKLLIAGNFDTVNDRPSQGYFVFDTVKKQVEYSSHVFSNNTYHHPICDSDSNFQYYELLPILAADEFEAFCSYNNPQYPKFKYLNNMLYITGNFDVIDGKTRYGLAVIDLATDAVTDFHAVPASFSPPTSFSGPTDINRAHSVPNIIADLMLMGSGSSKYLFLYGNLHASNSSWSTTSTGFRLNPTTGSQLNQVVMPTEFYTGSRYKINDSIVASLGNSLKFNDMNTGLTLSWSVDQDLYNQSSFSETYIKTVASYKDYVFVGITKRYNHYGATLLVYKINNGEFEFVKDLSSYVPKNKIEDIVPINADLGIVNHSGVTKLNLIDDTLIITNDYWGSKALTMKDMGL